MLLIAKILKSNGTDGDILIGMRDVEISEIDLKEPVFIYFDGLPVPFFFESLIPKGTGKAIAHITDVDCLEDAEELVGSEIWLDAESEEDEVEDFTGWTVFDRDLPVGSVTGFEDIPGNPCIYVGDSLVPLHEDFIVAVDAQKKELRLELPEGILNL